MLTLVVHPDADFRETLSNNLREHGIVVHTVTTEQEALGNIKQQDQTRTPYDLLVTNYDLAESRTTSILPGKGERLTRLLFDYGHPKTKCVVLGLPGGGPRKIALQEPHPPIIFLDSQVDKLFESVIDIACTVLNKVTQRRTLSVVFFQVSGSPYWQVWLNGQPDKLLIPTGVLQLLGSRSDDLNKEASWLKGLAEVGQGLQSLIFENNPDFTKDFKRALTDAGGIDKARFTFNVAQDTHRVALEALYAPLEQGSVANFNSPKLKPEEVPFWMLKAPICRTFSLASPPSLNRQSRKPLFEEDHGHINCLIIQADVSGEVTIPGIGVYKLPPLDNVLEECNWLERELKINQDRWGIGRVGRVAALSLQAGQSFIQELEKLAKDDVWHLVHYAGHSFYIPAQGSAGKGYFFLPGGGTGIQPLSADVFSELVLKAQFLFLSSCHSSEENFVLEMVRHGVPAVLGFRWDIDDNLAAGYAKLFYKSLFDKQSIESAFVIARNKARDDYGPYERIWAAPMLMLLEPTVRAEAA